MSEPPHYDTICERCGEILTGPHKGEHATLEEAHHHQYRGESYSSGYCKKCAPYAFGAQYLRHRGRAFVKRKHVGGVE